jgi:very-short-patch-repair endonuclease
MERSDVTKRRHGKSTQARTRRPDESEEEHDLRCDMRARRLNGCKFARQVPQGLFIVDFLCRKQRLIVKVDGFHYAHSDSDRRRTAWLDGRGCSVLRFWNPENSGQRRSVLDTNLAALSGTPEAEPGPGFCSPAAPARKKRERS